jgi:hypothetical protein
MAHGASLNKRAYDGDTEGSGATSHDNVPFAKVHVSSVQRVRRNTL